MMPTQNLNKEAQLAQTRPKKVILTNNLYLKGQAEDIEYTAEMKQCLDDFKYDIQSKNNKIIQELQQMQIKVE
jgi:hypothetical protein